jgi:hypothetical protein
MLQKRASKILELQNFLKLNFVATYIPFLEINKHPAPTLKLKQIRGFLGWLDSVVPNYFPADCFETFVCKKLGVHQDYAG